MTHDQKKRFYDTLPWRFFRKLALAQIVVTSLMIVTTAYIARYYLKTYIINQAQAQLTESLSFVESDINNSQLTLPEICEQFSSHGKTRTTLIALDGTPLCDSHFDIHQMENHRTRPEVQNAINGDEKFAFHNRYSSILESQALYGAIILKDQDGMARAILRLAFPLEILTQAMRSLDRSILLFIFPLLILTSLFSLYGSLQVSSPLRSILIKVDHMKRISQKYRTSQEDPTPLFEQSNEWDVLESTLDKAKLDLENYLNELYVENEKINILMESISDSILAVNSSEMILFANGQFRKNFVPREFKRHNLTEFKMWEILREAEIQNLFKEVMTQKESKKIRNIHLDVKGGRARAFFDITISPMKDSGDKVFGAVCVLHNVTDRKTAEQLREDFVTNVSHEVRTPLTALKGYVQFLKTALKKGEAPQPNDDINQCLDRIEANSDRLTHLFTDILNLSVIESKRKIERNLLSTEEISSHVISNIKLAYPNKQIDLRLDIQSPYVYANGPLLEQVLTNLLDNAYKYTKENCIVTVEWLTDSHYYILIIRDSGEQIPKHHHPRLFERFYRVDSARSRGQGGTGLGLAIVKHIVQKHYGNISVGHNKDVGNYFKVELPIKESFG